MGCRIDTHTPERRKHNRRASDKAKSPYRYCHPSLLQLMALMIFLMMFVTGRNILDTFLP